MKNIIKYLGCLALGLLILNKVDFSVYAAEPSKVVRHVEYDEITDVNQLLQMGIEEYQKTPKVRNQSENEEITVKQLLSLNYSWISIRPNNCTMSSKIDSGSNNYSEIICQKGIKSLWQFLEELFSCQGSLIIAIPAVHTVC